MKKILLVALLGSLLAGCGNNMSQQDCNYRGGELVKAKSGRFVCAKLV